MDLMKRQLIQGTFTTRSIALPPGAVTVDVRLNLGASDSQPLEVLAELQGQFGGRWRPILNTDLPTMPTTTHDNTAARVRLVLDPSRPVSVGATITIG